MNCGAFIIQSIPTLKLTDSVGMARDCMDDAGFEQLPVVDEGNFKGLVYLSDILAYDERLLLSDLTDRFAYVFVRDIDFFLTAMNKMHEFQVKCMPVINTSEEYTGAISLQRITDAAVEYLSAAEPGGIIILQMTPHQFSISELGRIIESNNAKIIHLTTWTEKTSGELMVSMKVNKIDIQDILASFERYQFTVYQYFGENLSEETLKNNFDNLMNYLRF
jgi:acetoin utilization protein AcuB